MPAIPVHNTPTTDEPWDGPANEARLRLGESAAYYGTAYAWRDPDANPETKSAYKFIHHEVEDDGEIGEANLRGCLATIANLNGARTPPDIPEADRAGVYRHVAAHLADAEREAPDLKSLGLLRRVLPFELKASTDRGFVGMASVFGTPDRVGDVVVKGAFARTLREQGNEIVVLYQHHNDQPIGLANARETDEGLDVDATLNLDLALAREVHSNMSKRILRGLSFGYTLAAPPVFERGYRLLKDLDLWEISPVTMPAHPDARVTVVKSVRDFEALLRDAGGFSRRDATALALHGWKGLSERRDAAAPEALALIEKITNLWRVHAQ